MPGIAPLGVIGTLPAPALGPMPTGVWGAALMAGVCGTTAPGVPGGLNGARPLGVLGMMLPGVEGT